MDDINIPEFREFFECDEYCYVCEKPLFEGEEIYWIGGGGVERPVCGDFDCVLEYVGDHCAVKL